MATAVYLSKAVCVWHVRTWRYVVERCPLLMIWLVKLSIGLLILPVANLCLHQLLVHYWVWEVGFLDSWSLSFTILVGDSLLVIGSTQAATASLRAYRKGCKLWPDWLKQPISVLVAIVASGCLVAKWIFDINGRPINEQTTHHYAWIYDAFHLTAATLTAVILLYGGLALMWLAAKRQADRFVWVSLLIMVLTIGSYFAIVAQDHPAVRFKTGVVVETSPNWPAKLFSQSDDLMVEVQEDAGSADGG